MLSNRAATVSQSSTVVPTDIPTLGVLRVTASMNYCIKIILILNHRLRLFKARGFKSFRSFRSFRIGLKRLRGLRGSRGLLGLIGL